MCDKPQKFPGVPKGWDHISPPLTPEELLERKKKRDEENRNTRTCILEDSVR